MVSGKCLRILAGHSWSVAALIFATNRLLISGSWDTTLKVWQIDTGVEITQLVGHTDSVTSVALSRQKLPDDAIASTLNDAVLISGSRDQTIKRWQFSVP
jgi:WD40 repeat protein